MTRAVPPGGPDRPARGTRLVRLEDAPRRSRRIAIGVFDGVHLGHREVIRGSDAVLTFDPPPAVVLGFAPAQHLLTTLEQRRAAVERLGVAELIVIGFDRDVAAISPTGFMTEWLEQHLGATHVSVGESFRFGRRGEGTPERLAQDGRFETRIARTIERDGLPVSSTRIRALVRTGQVAEAHDLLGRPFALEGRLRAHDDELRFRPEPTAIVPAQRAYRGRLHPGGRDPLDVSVLPVGDELAVLADGGRDWFVDGGVTQLELLAPLDADAPPAVLEQREATPAGDPGR